MQRLLNFIVAKDENEENIFVNIWVNSNREILSINFAGLVYEDEKIKKLNLKPIDKKLYEAAKDNTPIDITNSFKNMSKEEIIKSFTKGTL